MTDSSTGHHSRPDLSRRPRIPHVYVIIFGLTVLTAILGLFVPPGAYDRDADGRVVPGTFAYDDDVVAERVEGEERAETPQGWALLFAILKAPVRGIEDAAGIIAFILVIGGAFKVIEQTRAFETALRSSVRVLGKADLLVIPGAMLLFSIGGATFGMAEEIIPFVLLMVPMVRMLGYHPVVGVAIPVIGSQVGFAGAWLNPFTVGIAQGIAGLPPFSGWRFRLVLWLALTTVGIVFVFWQARRAGYNTETLDPGLAVAPVKTTKLTTPQILVLATLVAGIGVVIWGVSTFGWYVIELGAVFLGMGIVAGIVGRVPANRIAQGFVAGARELVSAALIVGIARGIVIMASDMRILDTVLHGAAGALGELPGAVALNLMFFFQTALNFFIPSGSGQAALTMPIMAPLAELVGLTRQMAVLAFQLGDGFSNMIIPTSVVLMGSLEAGKVSYERWFAFAWKLQVWLLLFGVATLTIAWAIGYGP